MKEQPDGTSLDRKGVPVSPRILTFRAKSYAAWKAKREAKRLRRGDGRNRSGTYQKTSSSVLAALCPNNLACGVCGKPVSGRKRAIHHIVPVRLIQKGQDANIPLNLLALCQRDHNLYTTQCEGLVFRCDFVSAQMWFKGHDWALQRVKKAFEHFGYELRLIG